MQFSLIYPLRLVQIGLGIAGSLSITISPNALAQELRPNSAPPSPTSLPSPSSPSSTPNPTNSADFNLELSGEGLPWRDDYILGAGDRIKIDIFGAEEYSGEALILSGGMLSLPQVGNISVQNMTLQQATEAIANSYRTYLHNPIVSLSVVSLRPVQIGISGEVNRPGSYLINTVEGNSSGGDGSSGGSSSFPTLAEAIQKAGGITPRANLRQIKVVRQQGTPGEQTITVNLWELLRAGNLSENIVLQGGDAVVVPTATAIDPIEAVQLGSASFAPDKIQVYVVGEVANPGLVELPPSSTLNQALLASGGFDNQRADRSAVNLVRLNPDGTATEQEVPIDFKQGINASDNPLLQNNDMIVVRRSGMTQFTDTADSTVGALSRILLNVFGLFNLF
jgi:polysaccharide biosynthesis/export protein